MDLNNITLFQTDSTNLQFKSKDIFSFEQIASNTGFEWLNNAIDSRTIWKISFVGPDGTNPTYLTYRSEFLGAKFNNSNTPDKEIIFSWRIKLTKKGECLVHVSVKNDINNSLTLWSISVELPSGWRVSQLEFPFINNIKLEENMCAAVPAGWGVEYNLTPGFIYQNSYPSCLAGIQMLTLYCGGQGLYIAAHDPKACLKDFLVRTKTDSTELSIIHFTSQAHHSNNLYELPYKIALGCYNGEYYEAAQIYRKFTFNTDWGNIEPVSIRIQSEWIKNNQLWLRPDGSPENVTVPTKKALEFFDVPTALHWYRWHQIPYDTLYPDYFPPLPKFSEVLKEFQKMGAHVKVYINGRLSDPDSKFYQENNGTDIAARAEDGKCYTEVYGSLVPNNVMCPYTETWQDKIAEICDKLSNEYGLNGIYIDQICAAKGVPCFNPKHGHPLGGGSFWYEGYVELLNEVKKKIKNTTILTSEENAECWLDFFDALLMVNSPTDGKLIPLFPAVYSGRTILICYLYFTKDEPQNWLAFRIKCARTFLWGAQLGWIQPERIMADDFKVEAEFLRNLAKARIYATQYLLDGKFLGMLNVDGDNPKLKGKGSGSFGGEYIIDEPAVTASAFFLEGKGIVILIVNISNEPHEINFNIPFDKIKTKWNNFSVNHFNAEGLVSNCETSSEKLQIKIPQRSALVIEIKK